MDHSKRVAKENKIIAAAEQIFGRDGFQYAKMEDIAQAAGITKVTLYSYFRSKENLYLAIVYNAFQALNDVFYNIINTNKSNTGFEGTLAIFDSFFDFCENHIVYSEAILDYFNIIRNITRQSEIKESDLADSIFYNKLQDIQILPIKQTVKEIRRGIHDGSIRRNIDPFLHTIQGWTMVMGYIKLIRASGNRKSSFLHVNPTSLRQLSMSMAQTALRSSSN